MPSTAITACQKATRIPFGDPGAPLTENRLLKSGATHY